MARAVCAKRRLRVSVSAWPARPRRRLIASVSHDLRTPIAALRAMVEAIDDDLVELSRLEAGDITWSLEQVQMDALVRETVEAMRPHADAGSVRVVSEVPGDRVVARANPEQMQRVLSNLIQNAIRHTPPDGSVVVRAG
jgi:signal transduction histidine kinase